VCLEGEGGGGEENEDDGGKCKPPATFLSTFGGNRSVRKYLVKFDVNIMTAFSSIEK
jgi:hypothetical protein